MIELTITFSIGAIVGWIVRVLISDRLARDRSVRTINITQKIQAVASFRASFAPTLAIINISKKARTRNQLPPDIDAVLWSALLKQATEIELFRPYIPRQAKTAYQEEWDKYVEEMGNYGFKATTFRTDIDNPYKIFEDLVHNILQFAELKEK